jgi:hypothetical protein
MTTIKNGKSNDADLATLLVAGITKHLSTVASLTFGKGSFTPAALIAQLTLLVTLRQAVTAAQAVVKAKLAAETAQAPALHATMVAFVAFVRQMFADQPDVLADFGLEPKKVPTPLTTAQKAAADAKRKATIEARGIVGKKKRAAVKGDVTGVTVTPVTSPSPATPAATPNAAPAGSTTGGAGSPKA